MVNINALINYVRYLHISFQIKVWEFMERTKDSGKDEEEVLDEVIKSYSENKEGLDNGNYL